MADGYAAIYFRTSWARQGAGAQAIPGIETPDDQTIVFKLTEATAAALAGALAMPISVPVPKEYAKKFDKQNPSTYGEGYVVFTGPYMVKSTPRARRSANAREGDRPGPQPGLHPVDDFRPAYLDEIDIEAGNDDTSVPRAAPRGPEPGRATGAPPAQCSSGR